MHLLPQAIVEDGEGGFDVGLVSGFDAIYDFERLHGRVGWRGLDLVSARFVRAHTFLITGF